MKKYFFLVVLLSSFVGFSQSINDYKYAIVPSKFSFVKEKDQYRLNTLTKLFMEKYGFITYFDTDVMPDELVNQNCNKVYVNVLKEGNMFITKLTVQIKDCRNMVLYTSSEGKSREKEYKVAYTQALREALNSLESMGYKYSGDINSNKNINKDIVHPVNEMEDEIFLLSAQPIINGYLLIGNEDKIYMKILKTSNEKCFIAVKGTVSGIFFLKDNIWFFEYYENEKLVSEKVQVKF